MNDDQDDDDIVVRLKDHGLFNKQQRNRLFMEAADEIERLRDMCINREEFIAQHGLWKEFSQYLSEPPAEGKGL